MHRTGRYYVLVYKLIIVFYLRNFFLTNILSFYFYCGFLSCCEAYEVQNRMHVLKVLYLLISPLQNIHAFISQNYVYLFNLIFFSILFLFIVSNETFSGGIRRKMIRIPLKWRHNHHMRYQFPFAFVFCSIEAVVQYLFPDSNCREASEKAL